MAATQRFLSTTTSFRTRTLPSSHLLLNPLQTPLSSQQPDTFLIQKILMRLKQGNLNSSNEYLLQLTPSSFIDIIQHCRNNPQLGQKFIDTVAVKNPKFKHSSLSLSSSIHILSRNRKLSDAQSLMLRMIRKSGVSRSVIVDCLISTYDKCGSSPVVFDLLIRTYVQARKLREGVEAFRLIKNRGICVPINGCNSVLGGLVKMGWVDLAWEVYNEIVSIGIEMNVFTMNIMVNLICTEQKFDKVEAFLVEFEMKGVFPDIVTYNTLINGYSKAGNLKESLKIMNQMSEKGLKMDTFTVNTVLHALCLEKKLDEAYNLLIDAKRRGYIIDDVSYGTLIVGYFKNENPDKALKLWDEMKEREIVPSIITYNSVICGLCKSGKTEQAMIKLDELLENGLSPDETTYNTVILGYCWELNVEKAFKFYNDMVKNGFKPDIYTCNILLHGLCSNGLVEKAFTLFKTWVMNEKTVDSVTYNTLISCLCKDGRFEDAMDLVIEMKEKNLGPDEYTYNAVLGTLTDAGKHEEAEELMKKMVDWGGVFGDVNSRGVKEELDASSGAYSEDIDKLCSEGKYRDAMRLFGEVYESGTAVKKSTCVSLMSAFVKREIRRSNTV